jgi:hypothetical protein
MAAENDSPDVMIARIDERVKSIVDALPKFATIESVSRINDHVEVVETNLKTHIERGRWTIGNTVAVIASAAGFGSFLVVLFK